LSGAGRESEEPGRGWVGFERDVCDSEAEAARANPAGSEAVAEPDEPLAEAARALLYSRQQAGQRHSRTVAPSLRLKRVRRQPNCALINV
jgi:hypothetical protein